MKQQLYVCVWFFLKKHFNVYFYIFPSINTDETQLHNMFLAIYDEPSCFCAIVSQF